MEKVRYGTDPFNRLTVSGVGTGLSRNRTVLDGTFSTGRGNSLVYHVKAPDTGKHTAPHQVRLKGSWSLTKDHGLSFKLDRWRRSARSDSIELSCDIIDIKADAVLFSVTTRRSNGAESIYVLELSGSWRADGRNRLNFMVRRERGRHDVLTFEGAWDLSRGNEIAYRYEKSAMIRRKKTVHTLILRGRWAIRRRGFVSYEMAAGSAHTIDFRASAGVCSEAYIKFEIGIRAALRRLPVVRSLALYGRWNIRKGSGLYFEVRRPYGGTYAIELGAQARLTDRDTVLLSLTGSESGRDLGLSLELSRLLLQGSGASFVKLISSNREKAVLAGAGMRW